MAKISFCSDQDHFPVAAISLSLVKITFVLDAITFEVAVIISSVTKITFVVAEITFEVVVITSSVVKITFVVITFLVDDISLLMVKLTFVVAGIMLMKDVITSVANNTPRLSGWCPRTIEIYNIWDNPWWEVSRNKVDIIADFIIDKNGNIMALTETWLQGDMTDVFICERSVA